MSYFISSSFRLQISASVLRLTASTHAACYPHVPKASPRNSDTNLNLSPEMQRRFIHSRKPLRFQVSIAFLLLRPLTSDSARHFDFRLRFQVSSSRRERTRNRDFDFRFQISDSGEGQKSKSRLRFQISGFRLWRGREIEIETSISISGFDFRRVS